MRFAFCRKTIRIFAARSKTNKIKKMEHKPNALALANYILQLATEKVIDLRPLKLMKLVYIAHGFILALLGRSALNPRFDKVEAWKYGPVIPSVYHSFKSYGKDPIDKPTTIFEPSADGTDFNIIVPTLTDKDKEMQAACQVAFWRFCNFSDSQLVTILHWPGSPWEVFYEDGKNNIIPDSATQRYYDVLIDVLLENKKREE